MTPDVTIVIPTFNRADLLPQAIDSALAQSYPAFELLVLDDASTDETSAVMRNYSSDPRVRYFRNDSNLGIARNRNRGIEHARGRFIAMLDSDDVWLGADKLERQVAFLDSDVGCALIGTDAWIIDRDGRRIGRIRNLTSDFSIRNTMFIKNQFVQSSVLIRKSALAAVGGYCDFSISEDYELWLRLGTRFRLANLPQPLTGYRVHGGNISGSNPKLDIAAFDSIYTKHGTSYPFRAILKVKILRERWRLRRRGPAMTR